MFSENFYIEQENNIRENDTYSLDWLTHNRNEVYRLEYERITNWIINYLSTNFYFSGDDELFPLETQKLFLTTLFRYGKCAIVDLNAPLGERIPYLVTGVFGRQLKDGYITDAWAIPAVMLLNGNIKVRNPAQLNKTNAVFCFLDFLLINPLNRIRALIDNYCSAMVICRNAMLISSPKILVNEEPSSRNANNLANGLLSIDNIVIAMKPQSSHMNTVTDGDIPTEEFGTNPNEIKLLNTTEAGGLIQQLNDYADKLNTTMLRFFGIRNIDIFKENDKTNYKDFDNPELSDNMSETNLINYLEMFVKNYNAFYYGGKPVLKLMNRVLELKEQKQKEQVEIARGQVPTSQGFSSKSGGEY